MMAKPMTADDLAEFLSRFSQARNARAGWEQVWRECRTYALPMGKGGAAAPLTDAEAPLYDGTAPDAADQLAASLLAELTPPWSRWFSFHPGRDAEGTTDPAQFDRLSALVQSHFDRSNFAVEAHQCYLDLVTCGSASLLFEEAPLGEASAFRFTAVPLDEVMIAEGPTGLPDITWRRSEITLDRLDTRFPGHPLPGAVRERLDRDPGQRLGLVEAVETDGTAYRYRAVLEPPGQDAVGPLLLMEGEFNHSPFINFRWIKVPGEAYGRSPVMKALPDIRTANKVVELVLKNASIAVTGIWQADDDGVLNPANVRLLPGVIIPKAVGSSGLTPLSAPGRFDISQLVLDDLRKRIRHAMMVDRLGPVDTPAMTATEVLERAAEMARMLGAVFGRLQGELLTPLVHRALRILHRRGEIPDIALDGRAVELRYQSPLARVQARADIQSTLLWMKEVQALGPGGSAAIDPLATARWLGRMLGVPGELLREQGEAGAES